MAKLILSMDGLVLKEIPLAKERTTIGRKPHNDIQIDNLAVSGEHAVIVTILNDSFLEDLGSTNGTLVNGKPIKKHFLQNNDVVELGKYKLKYVGEAPAAARRPPAEGRLREDDGAAPRGDEGRRRAGEGDGRAAGGAQPRRRRAGRAAGRRERRQPPASPTRTATATAPAAVRRRRRRPPRDARAAAATAPARPRPAAGRDPAPLGRQRRQGAGATKPLTTLGKPGVQVAVITRRPQGYFITHVEGANPRPSTARRSAPRRTRSRTTT